VHELFSTLDLQAQALGPKRR